MANRRLEEWWVAHRGLTVPDLRALLRRWPALKTEDNLHLNTEGARPDRRKAFPYLSCRF